MSLTAEEIARLSREEKLQLMETIWADLSKDDSAVESPPWHKKALDETQVRLEAGEEAVLDWEEAKRILRHR